MQTLFYFNDVSQLKDFKGFEVKPVSDGHSDTIKAGQSPKFWSVIGTLKDEKGSGPMGPQVPVADLPTELYAQLFAHLCEQVSGEA